MHGLSQAQQDTKGHARDQVGNLVDAVIGAERDKVVGAHKVESVHNTQQQARGAMSGRHIVVGTTDVVEHLLG